MRGVRASLRCPDMLTLSVDKGCSSVGQAMVCLEPIKKEDHKYIHDCMIA